MKDLVVNLIELSSAEDRVVKFRFQNPKFFVVLLLLVSLTELARDCRFLVSSILLYFSLSL